MKKIILVIIGVLSTLFLINCSNDKANNDNELDNQNPIANWEVGPVAGNPNSTSSIPTEAKAENVSNPDVVIGNGTPESCTCDAVVNAIAKGGKITFNCGSKPITIKMDRTAKVYNNANPDVIIDGGGLVTLSGGGTTRILYMNTCDEDLVWTTNHCDNQDSPRLTVQNITFANGKNLDKEGTGGGGAIWARGGRLKVVNCRFFNNQCAIMGADVGGGAIRAFSQYNNLPIYVVNSTFGGEENTEIAVQTVEQLVVLEFHGLL